MERFDGIVMGVNYGFDKVRFINPVKVGSQIRAARVLASVDLKDANNLQVVRTVTVEIDGRQARARRRLGHPSRLRVTRPALLVLAATTRDGDTYGPDRDQR